MLHEYAVEWIERYHGTGKRGFGEETRDEYRGLLHRYALTYFRSTMLLVEVGPKQIAEFVGWLVKQPNGRGGTLSDKAVRNTLGPLSACLATAGREGLISQNPATDAALPHRPRVEEDEELPRPFPDGMMEMVVSLVHPGHRLMFELLAATGMRRSELLALEVRHLALDGDRPLVKVRQRTRWQKGRGQVMGPLKSRHARRDLPIPLDLADALRAAVSGRRRAGVRESDRSTLRSSSPAPARSGARVRRGRRRVSRFPHVPSHGRVAHVRRWSEREADPSLARSSLRVVHAEDVRAPARRGRSRRPDRTAECTQSAHMAHATRRHSPASRSRRSTGLAGISRRLRHDLPFGRRVRIPVAVPQNPRADGGSVVDGGVRQSAWPVSALHSRCAYLGRPAGGPFGPWSPVVLGSLSLPHLRSRRGISG
jgi:integrase